ncbi:large conductance mechanosensitive channel protein MscL [Patescibacteria group bacterium]|nr:large conductance mechanosensitive channel protein MscL [Patescibacteria group bacterium]
MIQPIKGFFAEFQKFATRGNFIDLAIGIVIGTSFTAVTNSLVNNILTPPIGLLIGGVNFNQLVIPLGGTAQIQYGVFLQTLLNFVITALALFVIVRLINRVEEIAKRRKKQDAAQTAPAAADSPEVAVLKDIREALKHLNILELVHAAPETPHIP